MAAVEARTDRRDEGLALLFTPPFDQHAARSRLHQGLSAGHSREWRPVHPRRHMVGHCLRPSRRRRQGGRPVLAAQPDQPRPHPVGPRRYKVEPYVVAADVYSATDHVGRGGWTWYTGSAAWMYRAGMEEIAGLRLTVRLSISTPAFPKAGLVSRSCSAAGRPVSTSASTIPRELQKGIASARIDGRDITERPLRIDLPEDGASHEILVTMG